MTASGAWKAFEVRVAKAFGGIRVGGMGDNALRKSHDAYTDDELIECKLRDGWPSENQIVAWFELTEQRAAIENKRAVLCIQIKNYSGHWIIKRRPSKTGIICMSHCTWFTGESGVHE